MIFSETPLVGSFVIDLEKIRDNRGYFARSFCVREFKKHGLKSMIAQGNTSYNHKKGTMRGMHYQQSPAVETKLVRCIEGAIWDVIVDIRPESPTYMQSFGVELSAQNGRALYVPEMFAHGYLTLTDNAEVTYSVGEFYTPGAEGGYRHNDPALGIIWPMAIETISAKDAIWPLIDTDKGRLKL